MTTADKVKGVVVDQLGGQLWVDPSEVKPEANLFDDLGCDSLDHVELIMAAEEEFGISISDDVAEKIITVQGLTDAVNAALEGR
jgi:acyl carrier protein